MSSSLKLPLHKFCISLFRQVFYGILFTFIVALLVNEEIRSYLIENSGKVSLPTILFFALCWLVENSATGKIGTLCNKLFYFTIFLARKLPCILVISLIMIICDALVIGFISVNLQPGITLMVMGLKISATAGEWRFLNKFEVCNLIISLLQARH